MALKYLLSTGESTNKTEEYIIDLFRVYLTVYPGDIPHYGDLGFDFLLTDITKDNLVSSIKSRVKKLISKISSVVPNYSITINTLDVIDEERVKLVIDVNGVLSEDLFINLYKE